MNKLYLFIFGILLSYCSIVLGQNRESSSTNTSRIKTVVIPIGSNEGEVTVGYLCGFSNLSTFVCPPDVFEVLHNGNFVLGSRLQKASVQIFDRRGRLVRVLARKGMEDGSVIYPLKVGSDKNDNIYILDCNQYIEPGLSTENYSLKVFTVDGRLLKDEKLWNTFSLRKERDRVEDIRVYPDGYYILKVWENGGVGDSETKLYSKENLTDQYKVHDKPMLEKRNENFYTVTEKGGGEDVLYEIKKYSDKSLSSEQESFRFSENIRDLRFIGSDKKDRFFFSGVKANQSDPKGPRELFLFIVSEKGNKIEKRKLGKGSNLRVDGDGNVYQLTIDAKSSKEFTPGDAIKIYIYDND